MMGWFVPTKTVSRRKQTWIARLLRTSRSRNAISLRSPAQSRPLRYMSVFRVPPSDCCLSRGKTWPSRYSPGLILEQRLRLKWPGIADDPFVLVLVVEATNSMGLSMTVEPLPEDSGSRSEIHEKDHRVHVDRSGQADARGKRLGGAKDSSRAVAGAKFHDHPRRSGRLCDPVHVESRSGRRWHHRRPDTVAQHAHSRDDRDPSGR